MGGYRSTMPESNCTIGAMTYRTQGHGGHGTGTGRLHLAKADPWRQAVAAIFGDERAVIDDLHWEYPDGIQEDDIVLTVVGVVGQWDGDPGVADAAVPVVVELGTVVQLGDDLDVEADAIFADGVSVAAIAHRLGEAPPASPTTIEDSDLARRIVEAIEAELESPTSWRHEARSTDPATVRCMRERRPVPRYAEFFGCAACDRTEVELEVHRLADPEDLEFAGTDEVHVCPDCHDALHTALPPLVADVICADRPLCPSCSMARTRMFQGGLIPGPAPAGRISTGCSIFSPADDQYECSECGFRWSEQDWHFPYATDADRGTRLRARLADIPPSPDAERPELWRRGRLVVGKVDFEGPPDGLGSAWDAPNHVVMLGDDRRVYTVDPRTVRRVELSPLTLNTMTSQYVTSRAGEQLFPRLRKPSGEVTLCSPYLTTKVAEELAELAAQSDVDWYLLTNLDPRACANRVLSADGLDALLDAGVFICHCDELHAKAYVVGEDFAMVGSANLTGKGLGGNAQTSWSGFPNSELSVVLPQAEVATVQATLDRWWDDGEDVDADSVQWLRERAERITAVPPRRRSDRRDAQALLEYSRQSDVTVWARSLGRQVAPEMWTHESWFWSPGTKNRPGIIPGDLVVIYSPDLRGCYAVVEVLDGPALDPDFVAGFEGEDRGQELPWVYRATPRLIPEPVVSVPPSQIGLTYQSLQGFGTRLSDEEFELVVRALADSGDEL